MCHTHDSNSQIHAPYTYTGRVGPVVTLMVMVIPFLEHINELKFYIIMIFLKSL